MTWSTSEKHDAVKSRGFGWDGFDGGGYTIVVIPADAAAYNAYNVQVRFIGSILRV